MTPCAAHPGRHLIHLDGPCRCFFGGPGPEFAPALHAGETDDSVYVPSLGTSLRPGWFMDADFTPSAERWAS